MLCDCHLIDSLRHNTALLSYRMRNRCHNTTGPVLSQHFFPEMDRIVFPASSVYTGRNDLKGMTMYNAVIFDFDGTIADSSAQVDRILDRLAIRYHFQGLSARDFKHREGLSFLKMIRMLLFIRKVGTEFKRRYGEYLGLIQPFDRMLDLLAAVSSAGYPLVIISSNTEANIREFFRMHHFGENMTVLSSEGLFGKHKAIRRYLRQTGHRAGDVLYVGDEIRDIHACHKAGINIAFVTWGLDGKEDVCDLMPRYIIDDPDQLRDIIVNR